jgi:glucan phosphoethanolaminetransferase (alkaline phosphatase superfamily)
MTVRNPFRKYRNKYVDKFLIATAIALALFSYIMAVYGYKLPLIFPQWGLAMILSTILAGFVMVYLVFAMMYYAWSAAYFWRLERLYERNPRLAVRYFVIDYYSEEAKMARKALKLFGLS